MSPKIIVISGPTASGKSKIALDLAQKNNGAIINADAIQIYRELPILSAQPSKTEQQIVPHFLYGHYQHWQQCSLASWLKLVKLAIDDCFAQKLLPIIVGGTGLYISALIDGINHIPEIEQAFYQQAEDLYNSMIKDDFIKKFGKSNIIDKQKLLRYASVLLQTGKDMDFWHQQQKIKIFPSEYFCHYTLDLPRQLIYDNCNRRFATMLENGAIEEVSNHKNISNSKAIGFDEICHYLDGKINKEQLIDLASQKTRNYAKRQLTWFRNKCKNAIKLSSNAY